jgi:hypothetical protein
METLRILPDIQGRKFGTIGLGYDRVQQLREEHSALLNFASLVLGVSAETMTTKMLADSSAGIQTRVDQLKAWPEDSSGLRAKVKDVLADLPVYADRRKDAFGLISLAVAWFSEKPD